ncbi:Transketolase, thiamine diphosphate binding domain-containing protein [Nemania serpens]|nr:Transketolase, thiamine diphosphate binding domain-containing protein [Nemania serpens]
MLHVSGYSHMTVDQIKMYADPKKVDESTGTWSSTHCPGHPEIEVPGVEVTTGPLGQGVANAVGLAIASKNLAATFNRDCDVINSHIFCVTGDGCLQEGVANEAMAIAGHFGLDNLTLLYDNNQVTCDGPLDWIASEDPNAKLQALGWHVIDVFDGDSSVESIVKAIAEAKLVKGKPTFVNIRTTIGYGTGTAGTFKSHHGTYTDEDAEKYATDGINTTHTLSERTKAYFASVKDRGQTLERDWNLLLERYTAKYPEEAEALRMRREGIFNSEELLADIQIPKTIQATRQFNGQVFNTLMDRLPHLFAGGADLWNSNQMVDGSKLNFDRAHPGGRIVRYGIREHAMAAVSNGIAAYAPGCFVPVTATFLMFYLYAAPGVRMGALSGLQVIHVATHDSIGEGQDGPTHQPVEVDSLFRAMPNLLFVRPADAEEVIGTWAVALGARGKPTIISLARDPALFSVRNTDRRKVARGGYVVAEKERALVTLVSCGSELQFAADAAEVLNAEGILTRVVSMPCIEIFEEQDREYQATVLSDSKHIISVEAYVSSMWARLCTASIAMDSYGFSGAGIENFARFGLDADGIVRKVKAHVQGPPNKDRCRWTLLK